jgi:hypothetical protein
MKLNLDESHVLEAVNQAALALYFDDNSDYGSALWEVLKNLAPEIYNNAAGVGEVREKEIREIETALKQLTTTASPAHSTGKIE